MDGGARSGQVLPTWQEKEQRSSSAKCFANALLLFFGSVHLITTDVEKKLRLSLILLAAPFHFQPIAALLLFSSVRKAFRHHDLIIFPRNCVYKLAPITTTAPHLLQPNHLFSEQIGPANLLSPPPVSLILFPFFFY